MNKLKVLKTEITVGSYEEFIANLFMLAETKVSSYVCLCNVHMLIEAFDSMNFMEIINHADLVAPDGMPVAKALELLYGVNQERIAGMDLIESIFQLAETHNKSIYLYGATQDTLNKIVVKLQNEYPGLHNVWTDSPPFRLLSDDEMDKTINNINQKNPDFVFVALGCPKQEKWMYQNKDRIHSCMVGLGGALPVYAGQVSRSPIWMQTYGLEWLYRLSQEPERLWKRYFYTNSKFIFLFLVQLFKFKIFKAN